MKRLPYALSALALLFSLPVSLPAQAGYDGSISFTRAERAAHEAAIDVISDASANCLRRDLQHHQDFLRRYGISPYYGDRGTFGKLSYADKKRFLQRMGKNPALLEQMEPISCVELAINCLGEGFRAGGQADVWKRIREFTVRNGVDGMATQYALQKLGWKILYWNPDVRRNQSWDRGERRKNPTNSDRFWGYHEENWQAAQRGHYLYNQVDDVRELVNFGGDVPRFLQNIPFFFGIAHGGYHVFPGTYGKVVEAHSTRQITDPKSLESDWFNPLANEGPTGGTYHSGLIAVPGKYLR